MHKRPSWFWCHYKAHSCSMYNRQVFISIQRCTMFIRPLLKTYLEDLVKSLLMRLRLKTISISILSDALTNTPSEQISTLCKWCQCGISSYGVNPWVSCAFGNVIDFRTIGRSADPLQKLLFGPHLLLRTLNLPIRIDNKGEIQYCFHINLKGVEKMKWACGGDSGKKRSG